jgi:hypothetical protein
MSSNNWLKDHLDKIETKIDKLDNRLDNVDVTLGKQSVILEDHTRRSLANEQQVELLKKKLETDLQPIKNHVAMIHGVFKFIGVIASIAGVIECGVKVLEYIKTYYSH